MLKLDRKQSNLAALQAGDDAAWTSFFTEFDPLIQSVVSWPKWRFDAHTREDLCQIMRQAIVKSIGNLRKEGSLNAFVKRICVNRCIDKVRSEVRENQIMVPLAVRDSDGTWREPDLPAGDRFDPVVEIMANERARILKDTLAKISDDCRSIIQSFYRDGYSYKEISAQQGIAVNTVGSRLARCLSKLRELLEPVRAEV